MKNDYMSKIMYNLTRFPSLLYGCLMVGVGLLIYFSGVVMGFVLFFADPHDQWRRPVELIVWYSGVPVVTGLIFIMTDLFVLLPRKRIREFVRWDAPINNNVTVVLTAYNDEESIGLSVSDFIAQPNIKRVIVIDNNSADNTAKNALNAGAIVVREYNQGYGHCVKRAMQEGVVYEDTEITLICEGDMTFRAFDVEKFMSYIPHADIVNGTRIVEQLRCRRTQLTTFMYYGNFFAGKLLEAKHIGRGTFTDVGTTYKMCRNSAIRHLLPYLNPNINLEFNAHFLDTALGNGLMIVECPITFHNRIGASKGGNVNNFRAVKVGLRMIKGIIFGWGRALCCC